MEEDDKGCPIVRMGVSGCFFWYRPTRVVLDQRPLNGCVCVCVCVCVRACVYILYLIDSETDSLVPLDSSRLL